MADTKITGLLSPQVTTNPATDVLPIVNIADTLMASSGSTRKITVNQLLGAGGTATLASATISGDLTVDTNTLKVVSSTDSIGVGFTPSAWAGGRKAIQIGSPAQVVSSDLTLEIGSNWWHDGTNYKYTANNPACLYAPSNGSHAWYNAPSGFAAGTTIGWNTLMTLNSTGLGVGMSPQYKLQVGSTTYSSIGLNIASVTDTACIFKGTPDAVGYEYAKIVSGRESSPFTYGSFLAFYTEGKNSGTTDTSIERLRIDSSGNVGIGVTPSAYGTGVRGLDIGAWTSVAQIGAASFLGFNSYASTTGQFNYKNNGAIALGYFQTTSGHLWLNAPSNAGAAGANATFTTVMTLDTNGNLILLSSNTPATLTTNGQLTVNATSNTNLRFSYRGSDGVTRVANLTLA